MNNKLFNTMIIFISVISLIEIVVNKTVIFSTVSYSLKLWVNSIIPSLFPFFIITEILISYNIINYIPVFLKKVLKKLFNVNDNVVTIFFLSIISGFPSSSKNIKYMYDNYLIDTDMGSHALIFTHFASPLFIMGTVSVFFLHSETFGKIILISHYIPNIILGILTRSNIPNDNTIINYTNLDIRFPKILIRSIKNSIDTLLMILGIISCFMIISTTITNIFNFDIYTEALIKGILEMTMGLKSVSVLDIPNIYKVVISSMILSFGGLSVHMQILSFIEDTNISYKTFFIARIYHSILSGILAYILYIIFI
ncbi:MAG: hypothetical protein IKF19_03310 [Bacilli bacterium]|nr:hypothetical protein [Bacilli bacterium]